MEAHTQRLQQSAKSLIDELNVKLQKELEEALSVPDAGVNLFSLTTTLYIAIDKLIIMDAKHTIDHAFLMAAKAKPAQKE
jgi:hypothetical protein